MRGGRDHGRVEATPTVARAITHLDADAGVVVTASHNPATDNGIKLWTPTGKAFGPDQREAIEQRIREDDYDLAAWDASAIDHIEPAFGTGTPTRSGRRSPSSDRRASWWIAVPVPAA